MAFYAPLVALGAGALMLPRMNAALSQPKYRTVDTTVDDAQKSKDALMEQYMYSGMPVQEHQYNTGRRKFDVDNPPVDLFVAGVDPFEQPDAITRRYDETADYWRFRIDGTAEDIQAHRGTDYLPRKKMPLVHSITREIRHPRSGTSTGFIRHAYMPEHANSAQSERADKILALSGIEESHAKMATGEGVYRHAPGQSFRYRTYG